MVGGKKVCPCLGAQKSGFWPENPFFVMRPQFCQWSVGSIKRAYFVSELCPFVYVLARFMPKSLRDALMYKTVCFFL